MKFAVFFSPKSWGNFPQEFFMGKNFPRVVDGENFSPTFIWSFKMGKLSVLKIPLKRYQIKKKFIQKPSKIVRAALRGYNKHKAIYFSTLIGIQLPFLAQ